jgi:hypothetical protein
MVGYNIIKQGYPESSLYPGLSADYFIIYRLPNHSSDHHIGKPHDYPGEGDN